MSLKKYYLLGLISCGIFFQACEKDANLKLPEKKPEPEKLSLIRILLVGEHMGDIRKKLLSHLTHWRKDCRVR